MNLIADLKDQLDALDKKILGTTCLELLASLEERRIALTARLERAEGDAIAARMAQAKMVLDGLKFRR